MASRSSIVTDSAGLAVGLGVVLVGIGVATRPIGLIAIAAGILRLALGTAQVRRRLKADRFHPDRRGSGGEGGGDGGGSGD